VSGLPGVSGRGLACQVAQPGQLGLQLPGFLLQLQDAADAGQVQAVGGQRADLLPEMENRSTN
jgi:hypothetical protein